MTEVNTAAPADEMVPIDSVPQFAALVANWHGNVVAQLEQGLAVPDDVSISMGIIDGEPEVELTEEMRVGFKAGLVMALSLFESLPFGAIEEAAQPADDEEGTGQ